MVEGGHEEERRLRITNTEVVFAGRLVIILVQHITLVS